MFHAATVIKATEGGGVDCRQIQAVAGSEGEIDESTRVH